MESKGRWCFPAGPPPCGRLVAHRAPFGSARQAPARARLEATARGLRAWNPPDGLSTPYDLATRGLGLGRALGEPGAAGAECLVLGGGRGASTGRRPLGRPSGWLVTSLLLGRLCGRLGSS